MILRKAAKGSLFVVLSLGLSLLYSVFAVLFASGWSSDFNIFFVILAAVFLLGYLLLIQLNTFIEKNEEFVYLAGMVCFLMPVIYGIGQAEPLLIRESLSSVYFFIFFSGILNALKTLLAGSDSVKEILKVSTVIDYVNQPTQEVYNVTAGQYCNTYAILLDSGAVFEIADESGVPGQIFVSEGYELPAGARLISPEIAKLQPLAGKSQASTFSAAVYLKSVLDSLKAFSQRYILLLLLFVLTIAALLLNHFPYDAPARLSLWFQLLGGVFFISYLILQLRKLSVIFLNFALTLFRNGCQIFDFQRLLELSFRVKNFRLKLSGTSKTRILSELRIIDEQINPQKLNELLFYLISDSRNPDFALIRSHLKIAEINPASFGLISGRIETPTGITAWLDNKKIYLGNEAFIIQNGVFVNASEYLSFDSGNDNVFFAIDQELLAGFIMENISEEHLKDYAQKLKGTKVVLDLNTKDSVGPKALSNFGLSIKSSPIGAVASVSQQSDADIKLLLAESVFAPAEIADIYLPQPNWARLKSFFFAFDRLRKIMLINGFIIAIIFLIIFSSSTLLLLSQMMVLLSAIYMASITFQIRYLQEQG